MKRLIKYDLNCWRHSSRRKPMLMRGARQVGKTFEIRKLGKQFTHFLEINFEKQPDFIPVFEKNLDPVRIIDTLSSMTGIPIIPDKTLLFFDELQFCENALKSLRYFYEDMPALHVIGAGSLLDFAIEAIGVPVGRIEYCFMYPLSWMEYLASTGNTLLFEKILSHDVKNPFDEILHQKLFELLAQYMQLGGMPEVIADSLSEKNSLVAFNKQLSIINTYRDDFPKYAKKLQIKYVEAVFNHIPHCVAQSFKFTQIPGNYQKRELEPALNLLVKAGVVHKILQTAGNGVPLSAEANLEKYKLIFLDVALSQAMLGNQFSAWLLNPLETFINKGSFAESLVGQEFLAYSSCNMKTSLHYWHREKTGSHAEIDYLIQLQDKVVPVEVKSGAGTTLKSMHLFLDNKTQTPFGIRFSTHNYSVVDRVHSYPLYAIAGLLSQYDEWLRKKLCGLI